MFIADRRLRQGRGQHRAQPAATGPRDRSLIEQRKSRYDLLLEELGDCLMLRRRHRDLGAREGRHRPRRPGRRRDRRRRRQHHHLADRQAEVRRLPRSWRASTTRSTSPPSTCSASMPRSAPPPRMLRLIMHELPAAQVRAPALAASARTSRSSNSRSARPRRWPTARCRTSTLPEGVLLSAILRDGKALLPPTPSRSCPATTCICLLAARQRDAS